MRIYFAGSIRGGRSNVNLYSKLIRYLQNYGEVLTEHVGDKKLKILGEDGLSDEQIYQRDLEWLLLSDVVVAEASIPSLGVGFEISTAKYEDKPILCLYRSKKNKKLSAIISGCPYVTLENYKTLEGAILAIDKFLIKIIRESYKKQLSKSI